MSIEKDGVGLTYMELASTTTGGSNNSLSGADIEELDMKLADISLSHGDRFDRFEQAELAKKILDDSDTIGSRQRRHSILFVED
jgi:hypothetical protein